MTGIIGAMQEEVQELVEAMKVDRTGSKAGMEFFCGTLEGCEVVVVRCGIGKVNAAVCTQILIDDFDVDRIINTGIAGSLDAGIDIADVVGRSGAPRHGRHRIRISEGSDPQDGYTFI